MVVTVCAYLPWIQSVICSNWAEWVSIGRLSWLIKDALMSSSEDEPRTVSVERNFACCHNKVADLTLSSVTGLWKVESLKLIVDSVSKLSIVILHMKSIFDRLIDRPFHCPALWMLMRSIMLLSMNS